MLKIERLPSGATASIVLACEALRHLAKSASRWFAASRERLIGEGHGSPERGWRAAAGQRRAGARAPSHPRSPVLSRGAVTDPGRGARVRRSASLCAVEEGMLGPRLAPAQRSPEGSRLSRCAGEIARAWIPAPAPAKTCGGETAPRAVHAADGAAGGARDAPTRYRRRLVVDGHGLGRREAREAVERVRRALPLSRIRRAAWRAPEVQGAGA